MAEIGLTGHGGLFKSRKWRGRMMFRAYNKRVTKKSVEKSLNSQFDTLNPHSPFYGKSLTRREFDLVIKSHNARASGSGIRACHCSHTATDHRNSHGVRAKLTWCSVPECLCERYERPK